MRDPRYDILFEPVRIGRFLTKNRFYQTPHCNGMGSTRPQAHAAMRGMKAEGGWAVVNTEHCTIHQTADILPEVLQTLWDDGDVKPLALMVDAVHAHGALAGIQLAYAAYYSANLFSREVPLGPVAKPVDSYAPLQSRAMDLADIRNLRRWWHAAAKRSRAAGFDIINVDANFSTIAFQFLSPRNRRADEYGGPLVNRVRLLRELIEETGDAVGGDCAISVRLIIDELIGKLGVEFADEGLEIVRLLAELPDLWDIVAGKWAEDSPTSRFAPENHHEQFLRGLKSITTKPVVGVGRFTSPDTMAALVRQGVLDMIGAARPSIADPFLPSKIEAGREDDIRECIGCNICVSGHFAMTAIRCTQNPTMGEEWRKDWHPEKIASKRSERSVLVVGSGPAGLECARALGQRGYRVLLAERDRELGGRVTREAALPGLSAWARVRDWRLHQLKKLATVSLFPESEMTQETILALGREEGVDQVVTATGSLWRRDGLGRANPVGIEGLSDMPILTPDDILAGTMPPAGKVVVFDDDHYYMGGVLAEKLARAGHAVTLVTPAADASAFTEHTLEVDVIARRLDELGIEVVTRHNLVRAARGGVVLEHVRTGRARGLEAASLVMVTARLPQDTLYRALAAEPSALRDAGIRGLARIGDCEAPAAIVHAVYAGHRFAREFEEAPVELAFRRERIDLSEA